MSGLLVVAVLDDQPPLPRTAAGKSRSFGPECRQLAQLVEDGWRLVAVYGDGLANKAPLAEDAPARSGGSVQLELGNELRRRGLDAPVVILLTQVLVRGDDPAFLRPTHVVGPARDEDYARRGIAAGETWLEEPGQGWRRVLGTPDPTGIVEIDVVRDLVSRGTVVVCGSSREAVVREADGSLRPVESVVRGELVGERLATGLRADTYLVFAEDGALTSDRGRPGEKRLERLTVDEARTLQKDGRIRAEDAGAKIEACCRFVEAGGARAIIAAPDAVAEAMAGRAGTWVVRR